MSNGGAELRLLVRLKPAAPDAVFRMNGGAKFHFVAEPLFESIRTGPTSQGVAPSSQWHLLRSVTEAGNATATEVANPWDICHQLLEEGLGFAGGGPIEFAEPDLQQQWLIGRPGAVAVALANSRPQADKQNPSYPTLPDNFWYRDADHAQWDAALAVTPDPEVANCTRVAHLDTGYDPAHKTLPKH